MTGVYFAFDAQFDRLDHFLEEFEVVGVPVRRVLLPHFDEAGIQFKQRDGPDFVVFGAGERYDGDFPASRNGNGTGGGKIMFIRTGMFTINTDNILYIIHGGDTRAVTIHL